MQHAGETDVVDVVPGGVGDGSVLAPTGHASIDQLLVARQALVRAETESLGDARSESLEQRVGRLDQFEDQFDPLWLLEIHRDGPPVPGQHVPRAPGGAAYPVDPDYFGAHVREHHAAERSRPDAGEFDDAQPVKWSHRGSSRVFVSVWRHPIPQATE